MRYENECQQLADMAKTALNLSKNACKERFEDLGIDRIYDLTCNELLELANEILIVKEVTATTFKCSIREKVNFQRAREELADVAACCVGLLAKINAIEKEKING